MADQAFILAVKILPKSHKSEIVDWEGDELKIRLKAIPEKGEANNELIVFLAKKWGVAKSRIELISGFTSRHKRLRLHGISEELKFLLTNKSKIP